jgi:hypothetical protein
LGRDRITEKIPAACPYSGFGYRFAALHQFFGHIDPPFYFSISITVSGQVLAQAAHAAQALISVTSQGWYPLEFNLVLDRTRIFFGQALTHSSQPLQRSSFMVTIAIIFDLAFDDGI